ncbi:hypothetical protein E4T39_04636 [Aureobasidium subglaciale]|nr:hypothetical protein E4T39_04636 [Aureobasidium subglaciale]
MSKRVADGQGGAERYGGMDDPRDTAMDPPRKATAAQLAKRSIKPLKGRPGSSRSSSPSKTSPSPGLSTPFGAADSNNPFAQSAPAPPAAASFNFGQSTAQTQSNPFNSISTSQSFPPNAPANANANTAAAFSFGQSQPANPPPAFAPPQASTFSFGASSPSGPSFGFGASPAKPAQQNGDSNKTPSFTFGSTPASPAPSAPASPAPAFNAFSNMSAPSFGGGEQPISAAEIHEIESAGPRLSQEGKLDQLANIVRHSEPKYKDADLAGLTLSALPAAVQRKMLDFVRGKSESVSLTSIASFDLSRYTSTIGAADSHAPPLFAEHMPQTYTHLPAFSEEYFVTNDLIDEPRLAEAAADANMPSAWQTGIAALQSRLDEEKTGMQQIHSYKYFSSSSQQEPNFTPPAADSFNPNAFAYNRPFQPLNSVEGGQVPFVNHPDTEYDTQHDMLGVTHSSDSINNSWHHCLSSPANNHFYQAPAEAPKSSFSFTSTSSNAPAATTSFSFGQSTTAPSSQPETKSSPFAFGTPAASASSAPTSGFKFGSTAETSKKDDAPVTSAFSGFGASTPKKDDTPAKAPTSAFNFGGAAPSSPAPATSSGFGFGNSTNASASSGNAFSLGGSTEKKDEAVPKQTTGAFSFGTSSPAAPPSPKPAEKKLPSFSFGAPAASKPADEVAYPSLNTASSQEPSSAPKPSFSFGQATPSAASSPFKPAAAPAASQSAGLGTSMFDNPPAQQKAPESTFKSFGASTSTPAQASAPSPSFTFGSSFSAQAPAPPGRSEPRQDNALSAPSTTSGVATPPASPQIEPSELGSILIKQLNESMLAHLASASLTQDWSAFMRFYLDQVADIQSENSAAPSTTAISSSSAPKQVTAPLAAPSTRGEKRAADEDVTKDDDHNKRSKPSFSQSTTSTFSQSTTPTKPLTATASLFDDILNSASKPQTPQQTNVFSATANKTPVHPATAPPVKSNPFGAIARNTSATPGPTAPKTSFVPPAGAQALPSSSNGTSAPAFQIPKFGATPAPASAPASGFQVPKFGGASSTAAPSNFLGSFGKQAADQEAKEREKRKEEDMDSDEDEEEWERRDAEKQAQKKAELLAASQALKFSVDASKKPNSSASAVFSFNGTPSAAANTSAASNIFGSLSSSKQDDEDEDDDTEEDEDVHAAAVSATPAKPSTSKSLFDRVSFDTEKEKTSDAPSASFKFSSFGSSGAATDNTWKGSDPIKFGASTATAGTTTPDGSPSKTAAAPKFSFGGSSQAAEKSSPFSGMMGAKPSTSDSIFAAAKPSAPTTGFSFGGAAPSGLAPPSNSSVFASAATSRATTPGNTTTDAEASAPESEPSETLNDAQKDLTALTADDLAKYDLIHEVRCKVTKFAKDSDGKSAWAAQGSGPLYLLASKETSKPRILMRADPSGKVVLNFNALLNTQLYKQASAKMAALSVPAEDKKVESFMCIFKDETVTKEFLSKLHGTIEKVQG